MNSDRSDMGGTAESSSGVTRYFLKRGEAAGFWSKGWLPVLGLLGAFIYGLFVTAPDIQAHTVQQVSAKLKASNTDILDISGDGQRVLIRAVGDKNDAERIATIAADATCRTWLRDASVCPTRVKVELVEQETPAVATPISAPAAIPAAEKTVAARPHNFIATRRGDEITLRGEIPNELTRSKIVSTAADTFARVTDELTISGDTGDTSFEWANSKIIPVMKRLDSGELTWKKGQLSVTGNATAKNAAYIRSTLAAGPGTHVGTINLSEYMAAGQCNAQFAALLDGNAIQFRTSKADLLPQSRMILQRVAELAQQCPQQLTVGGHTDSRGPGAMNQALSEARAASVVSALADLGVPRDQLVAKGYGASQPIGDNDTVAGRMKNRRIEILAMGR